MSRGRVGHGQTYVLTGTLAAGSTLVGLSGDPGALIAVSGSAENRGVTLKGGAAAHKQGVTLSDSGVLTNAGTIGVGGGTNSSHAALLLVGGTLSTSGMLVGQAGSDGAGGQILVGGSGVLRNTGTLTLAAGVAAGSAGATLVDMGVLVNRAGGVIDVAGSSGQAYPLNGGGASIVVTDSFTNDGTLVLYDAIGNGAAGAATLAVAGTMQNSGSVLVGSYQPFYDPAAALLAVSGSLINSGTIGFTGGESTFEGSRSQPGTTLQITGVMNNEGQINLDGGGANAHYTEGGDGAQLDDFGTVENSGTLIVGGYDGSGFPTHSITSGASVQVNGVLTNTGLIAEQQNSRIVINGSLTNEGALTAAGGLTFAYLDIYVERGGSISVVGVLTNAVSGDITLDGGISGYPSILDPHFPLGAFGASLSVVGQLTNDGAVTIAGGDGGVPDGTQTGYDVGGGGQLSVAVGGFLNNVGTIEIQQGLTSTYGVYGYGGLLTVAGALYINRYETYTSSVLTIDGGAGASTGELLVTNAGVLVNNGTINGTGVLLNQGTISSDHRGFIFTNTLINDGAVALSWFGASLVIDSAISADAGKTGLLSLDTHTTLTLRGSVAASQTVAFAGSQDRLELGHAPAFLGTLSGLAATDMIDFLKQDITSAVANGDTLTFGIAGGGSFGLALAAPLSGVSLTLQSDQNGGTDLLFSAAAGGG